MGEKGNEKICEKVLHGVERSASFLVDISKLNCLDDLKSNHGETMSHQDQALRQISANENREIAVRRKYMEDDHEDGWMDMNIRQNEENIAATFIFCTVIWGRLIYIDMLLYIFKLILVTSTLQHLMKIVKNFVNLI